MGASGPSAGRSHVRRPGGAAGGFGGGDSNTVTIEPRSDRLLVFLSDLMARARTRSCEDNRAAAPSPLLIWCGTQAHSVSGAKLPTPDPNELILANDTVVARCAVGCMSPPVL